MKKTLKLVCLLIALCMVFSVVLTACNKDCGVGNHTDEDHNGVCDVCKKPSSFKHVDANGDKVCDVCEKAITYTMNDYVSTTPSNWNELSSTDNNDSAIMDYIGSSFFSYDFKFEGEKRNADGTINAAGIIDGEFEVTYQAATALEDVTAQYGEEWGYSEKQIAAGGYIWKITLRDDLKWDDGTAIKAEDFVYTMKEQLNPLFQLERASEYYNNAVKIRNAKSYLYQGQAVWLDNAGEHTLSELVKGDDGKYTLGGLDVVIALNDALAWLNGKTLKAYVNAYGEEYFDVEAFESLLALADEKTGRVEVTDETIELITKVITTVEAWDETEEEIINYMYIFTEFPEVDFSEVGIFAEGDLDIVLVCDSPMQFFKEDGKTLSYLAAYNFSSLPLVKQDLYEQCKQQPQTGSTLWTTTYNTSLETSASWGPFKLTDFQRGKQFELSRNENWFGYALEENKGLYPVDRIVTQVIETEASSQMAFWQGEVDSLGISVTIADDYKNSPYAIFSPRVATFGVQVMGNLEALKNSGRNNGILAIKEFRQAMSLSLDRKEYNRRLSTANQACLGIMGEDYYYDVENGGVYRYSDQGKAALLRTYGFEQNAQGKWIDSATQREYATLDDAVEAMTGVNMTLAKEKANEAFDMLTADAEKYGYDASKKIQIMFGASEPSESADRTLEFLKEWIANLVSGTKLEGKVEVVMRTDLGEKWSEKFRQGEYEISTSGIGNAPFDPFYLMAAHLGNLPAGASVSYHQYWDVSEEMLTFTIPSVDGEYDMKGEEVTMSLEDWYYCLNGYDDAPYNWGGGFAPASVRLEILSKMEEIVLGQYLTLPTSRGMTSALASAKWSYITKTYNTMLGFGGMKYMTFNFADDEWKAFVAERGGDLRDFYKG